MRVKCSKCKAKAAVTSRKEITDRVTDLYCMCTNPDCGHSFVATLSFSHSLGAAGPQGPPAWRDDKGLAISG